MKHILVLLVALAILGATAPANAKSSAPKKSATKVAKTSEKYFATTYLVPEQGEYAGKRTEWLLSRSDKKLALVARAFAKAARMNGTARLANGKRLHCIFPGGRCKVLKIRTTTGATGVPLRAFRSIAADPHFLPLGSRVFIAEFAGLRLPNGAVHDGIFAVEDTGGRIRGHHIDIFVGNARLWEKFRAQENAPALPTKVTVKKLPAAISRR